VIVETYNSLDNAEFVAERAGGVAVVLAQEVNALPGVDTYEQLFERNVELLIEAFKKANIEGHD
jgi:ABC-type Zn uptake system ZnuABC Zn-binding protein ZnuA